MQLSSLRSTIYDREGPFATVYVERRSPGADAAKETELRWKALRENLTEAGAPEPVLDALEAALGRARSGEIQADGRTLVANEAGVLMDAPWDAALGAGDVAHWGSVPELGAYVRARLGSVRALVAIASQTRAVIRQEIVAEEQWVGDVDAESVEGGAVEGVHKPRGGALSHNQIQRRADEAVQQNVRDIAQRLESIAKTFQPHVLVLAGETKGRTALRSELSDRLQQLHVEVNQGGTDDDAAETALADQLRDVAADALKRHAEDADDTFAAALAHGNAVTGAEATARAAEMGGVETLLLSRQHPAPGEAWLLATCASGDAMVDLVDGRGELVDNIGAILRIPSESVFLE